MGQEIESSQQNILIWSLERNFVFIWGMKTSNTIVWKTEYIIRIRE
jgi:hypothetical protein